MRGKTQKEKKGQHGNALVYVLIAIALFAALSMTLSRQTDTNESGAMDDEQSELYAAQIISYAAQAKAAIDQMLFTGALIDNLDFTLPTAAGFNTAPTIDKVYHADGGGLLPGRLPNQAVVQSTNDPVPGWYLGRFNNVEWSATASQDVVLVAYQISRTVCEKLNYKVTGSTTIPTIGDSIKEVMIDDALYTGVNVAFTTDPSGTPVCSDCHKISSLCVENQAQNAYGFYTIIADQ